MAFTTKGKTHTEAQEFTSSYLNYGFNKVSIKGYDLKYNKDNTKVQLSFHLEGDKYSGSGFTGAKWRNTDPEITAEGPYGFIKMGIYFDPEDQNYIDRILANLAIIADITDTRGKVDKIEAPTLKEYLDKYLAIVKNCSFWVKLKAEEYEPGKYTLSFGEYKGKDSNWYILTKNIIEVEELVIDKDVQTLYYVKEGVKKFFKFDKNSKWDYKKYDIKPDDTKSLANKIVEDDDI